MEKEEEKLAHIDQLLSAAAKMLGDAQDTIFGRETTAPRGLKALATQIQYANSRVQNALEECSARKGALR